MPEAISPGNTPMPAPGSRMDPPLKPMRSSADHIALTTGLLV